MITWLPKNFKENMDVSKFNRIIAYLKQNILDIFISLNMNNMLQCNEKVLF